MAGMSQLVGFVLSVCLTMGHSAKWNIVKKKKKNSESTGGLAIDGFYIPNGKLIWIDFWIRSKTLTVLSAVAKPHTEPAPNNEFLKHL